MCTQSKIARVVFGLLLAISLSAVESTKDKVLPVRISEYQVGLLINGKLYPVAKKLKPYDSIFYRVEVRELDPIFRIYIWTSINYPTATDENGRMYDLYSFRFEINPDNIQSGDLDALEGPSMCFWGDCHKSSDCVSFVVRKFLGAPLLTQPQTISFKKVKPTSTK